MARFVITKIDRFINFLTMSVLISGSLFIHLITALTIKNYYGSTWGYISFMLPGFAELYLGILQISEQMYNYMIFLAVFLIVSAAVVLTWFIKNSVKSRLKITV